MVGQMFCVRVVIWASCICFLSLSYNNITGYLKITVSQHCGQLTGLSNLTRSLLNMD